MPPAASKSWIAYWRPTVTTDVTDTPQPQLETFIADWLAPETFEEHQAWRDRLAPVLGEARRAALQAAQPYWRHTVRCSWTRGGDTCDCGLDVLIREAVGVRD